MNEKSKWKFSFTFIIIITNIICENKKIIKNNEIKFFIIIFNVKFSMFNLWPCLNYWTKFCDSYVKWKFNISSFKSLSHICSRLYSFVGRYDLCKRSIFDTYTPYRRRSQKTPMPKFSLVNSIVAKIFLLNLNKINHI